MVHAPSHHLLRILLPIAFGIFLLAFVTHTIQAADAPAPDCGNVRKVGATTSYYDCRFAGTRDSAENTSRTFLNTYADSLNFDSGSVDDMRLVEVKHGLASTHTRLEQVLDGIPVLGGALTVSQGSDGQVQTMHSSYRSGLVVSGSAERSAGDAESLAMQAVSATALRHPSPKRLVWYPYKGQALLAWELTIYSAAPLGDFLTVVNAQTGDILFQQNRIAFAEGSGLVYYPNPYQTQGDGSGLNDNGDASNATLNGQRISVRLERLDDGSGLLKGDWADLATLNSSTLPDNDANEATRIYNYDRTDTRFEQVVIYHTIDQIQAWIHTLGFDDDSGIPNGIRDYPTLANSHWDGDDNSFYSTGDDGVHFGTGGVDDGEDGDIVVHEYGHAVQFNQNSNWGGGEMAAMGEGFGDILAAIFFATVGDSAFQIANAACVGEWDASAYSDNNPPCLRRVDGSKQYPEDLNGSVHDDGEIWSRALWDIYAQLGSTTTMQLVLEHHFSLPAAATMPIAARGVIDADNNLNSGANDAIIRTAFCDRGILKDDDCVSLLPQAVLSIGSASFGDADGNNNSYPDPGESITMSVILNNGGTAMATQISATLAAPAGGVTFSSTESAYPDLAAAQSAVNSAEFTFTVDPAAACGDTIDLAFAAEYHDAVSATAQVSSIQKLQVGEFVGAATNYPWSGSLDIPDDTAAGVSQSITLTGTDAIADLNVNLALSHTWVGDLKVTLTHEESNKSVVIIDRPGAAPGEPGESGCDGNDISVLLDDEATTPVDDVCEGTTPTIAGLHKPENPLSFFNGDTAGGEWTLTVSDGAIQDSGQLTAFSLDITTDAFLCEAVTPTAVLAVMSATTGGQSQLVAVLASTMMMASSLLIFSVLINRARGGSNV